MLISPSLKALQLIRQRRIICTVSTGKYTFKVLNKICLFC